MTILYFDDSDRAAAEALGVISQDEVKLFDARSKVVPVGDITLVAHTGDDHRTIGGRTPAQLANDFYHMFSAPLSHIYLISCMAGMSIENKPSLAQQFAIEIQNQGFINVNIHAVANPVDYSIIGMRVNVITKNDFGDQPGYLNAFLYVDKYSEYLDNQISNLVERLDFLRIKPGAKSPDESAEVGIKQRQVRELLRQRDGAKEKYTKIDIVSMGNYKEILIQKNNTFSPAGPLVKMSRAVVLAIDSLQRMRQPKGDFLRIADQAKRDKYLGYIARDITNLQKEPLSSYDDISRILHGDSTVVGRKLTSSYYNTHIRALKAQLARDLQSEIPVFSGASATADPKISLGTTHHGSSGASPVLGSPPIARSVAQAPVPLARRSVVPAAIPLAGRHAPRAARGVDARQVPDIARAAVGHTLAARLFQSTVADEIYDKLLGYIAIRESEWEFHYNFIGIMSAIYYVTDKITGTDHFNSKSRNVKLSAAVKLKNYINTGELELFNPAEEAALKEGRLGSLIAVAGGYDAIRRLITAGAQQPQPVAMPG